MREATIETATSATAARPRITVVRETTDTDSGSRRSRIWRVDMALVALVLGGAALRLWGVGNQSLWYDEWLTSKAASGSFEELVRYVGGQAGIPPAYFGLIWIWARLVGDGDTALRIFSVLTGVGTIPVAYAAAVELVQRRSVARLAAALVAVNPMLIWYSQEARPYSALALLGGASLWALARVHSRGRRVDYTIWAFICALAIAFQYFAVFLVAAEIVGLWVVKRPQLADLKAELTSRRRYWIRTFAPALVVLAGLAPFAIMQFARRGNHDWITDHRLSIRLVNAGRRVLAGPGAPDARMWMVGAAVLCVAAIMLWVRGERGERRLVAACLGLVFVPVVLALVANVIHVDVIIGRYMLVCFVPAAVGVAIALGVRRIHSWVGGVVLAAYCAASVLSVVAVARDPSLQRADWQAVAEVHETDDAGRRLMVLNDYGYTGLPMLRYLDDARRVDLSKSSPVNVDQVDILVMKRSTQPCTGFVGMSCDMWRLGARPPEPLMDRLSAQERDELTFFLFQARSEPDQAGERLDLEGLVLERIELDHFVIERYRLDEPVHVAAEDMVREEERKLALVLVSGTRHGSD